MVEIVTNWNCSLIWIIPSDNLPSFEFYLGDNTWPPSPNCLATEQYSEINCFSYPQFCSVAGASSFSETAGSFKFLLKHHMKSSTI